MRLKYKNTHKNPKALLYKRFTRIQSSASLSFLYYTVSDDKYWLFDAQTEQFTQVMEIPVGSNLISVENSTVLTYKSKYFSYNGDWIGQDEIPADKTLLSAKFNNIGKYQTNKYYFSGSFDYTVSGSVDGTTTQYIKGNIIPLTSLNIKFYNDDITVNQDDLVVIDGHLYSVENPQMGIKHQPKPYNIYYATLNSIL